MITKENKIISDLKELSHYRIKNFIAFDLDGTLITTIFTNDNPNSLMKFYKFSKTENRYSVLRPGAKELLESLHKKCKPIVIITDASSKRVLKILEQFDLLDTIDYILPREFLISCEPYMKVDRRIKPSDIIPYKLLIDDYEAAKNYNKEKCLKIHPFIAQFENNILKVKDHETSLYVDYYQEYEKEKKYFYDFFYEICKYIDQ